MNKKMIMLSVLVAMCIGISMPSFSQMVAKKKHINKVAKKSIRLNKANVPKVVTETFNIEFPTTSNEGWYGYPRYDFNGDWYGYNPYLYENDYPENYIVEFTKDNVSHKAIYSKEGKKLAVHKKVMTVPSSVSEAIEKGAYRTWKITEEKEEIFRDTDMDQLKVYKVEVKDGNKNHHLFYSGTGELLKDKTIR